MNQRSLRGRLAGTLTGFSLLIAVLFVGTTAFWLSESLERQFEEQYKTLIELFAEQAFFSVILDADFEEGNDNDQVNIQRVLESLVSRNVVYAQIIKNSQVVAENSTLESLLPAAESVSFDVTSTRHNTQTLSYVDVTRGLLGRSGSTNVTSYVRLGISLASLEASIQQQLWTLGFIGLGVTAIGMALGLVIFYQLWTPIRRLIHAVKRFGKGDLSATADVGRKDELGLLATEFNQMARRIAEKNHELEHLNQALIKANRTKTEFLSVMSHELRTPLNAILGYAELLDQDKYGSLDEAQRRPIRRLMRAGGHLLTLIENTLSFAKLELGVEKLMTTHVDGRALIVECMEQLQPLADERGIDLDVKGESIKLDADPMKLKQVLLNLIQNAIQQTDQGRVLVTLTKDAWHVGFKVSDMGRGFNLSNKQKLFEPFIRGEDSPYQSQSGVGLGLTVVDRYTRMHGGQVFVDSQQGKGTVFYIQLPVHAKASSGNATPHAVQPVTTEQ